MQQAGNNSGNRNARVVALLSGSGRTLRNLHERSVADSLSYTFVRVISTRSRVRGNDVARELGIPLSVVARRRAESVSAFSDEIIDIFDSEGADLVVCAGFLSKLIVPDRYMGRIVNIHPSLLPLFGGKGYYGDRVHQAVLDSGMKVSGCTAHFVDNAYDAGPIIAQRCVPVVPDETTDSLAQRVFAAECELYPSVVRDLINGDIWLDGRTVRYTTSG